MEFKDTGLPDHPLVVKAFEVAQERHGHQLRGTTSGGDVGYISHPVLAAQILHRTIPDCPPELLAAGLTHDLIEDTGMSEEELGALLSPEVATLVKNVSFDPALKGAARVEFQQQALSNESLNARRLKVADRLANLLSLTFDPSERWTVVNKYDYWAASKTLISTANIPDKEMRKTADQILNLAEHAVFLAVKDRAAEKGLGSRHWKNMSPGLEEMRGRALADLEKDKNLYDENGRPRQKASDFDDLYSHAATAHSELAQVVTHLQLFSGFEAVVPEELKKQDRAQDVVAGRYGGDHRCIKDIARVSVVCETMEQAAFAIHAISQSCHVVEIHDRFNQPPMSAYRDAAMVVCSGDGHFCEVQVHLRHLWEAKKNEGDAIYARLRQFVSKELTPAETKEKRALYNASRELYKKAAEKHGFTDHTPAKNPEIFRPTPGHQLPPGFAAIQPAMS